MAGLCLDLTCTTLCFNWWHGCTHDSMPIIFVSLLKPEGINNTLDGEVGAKADRTGEI